MVHRRMVLNSWLDKYTETLHHIKYMSTGLCEVICILHSRQAETNFMDLLTAEFCADNHHSSLALQVPNFCAYCASRECQEYTRAEAKFFNLWNTVNVCLEHAGIISRATKLGPRDPTPIPCFEFWSRLKIKLLIFYILGVIIESKL